MARIRSIIKNWQLCEDLSVSPIDIVQCSEFHTTKHRSDHLYEMQA